MAKDGHIKKPSQPFQLTLWSDPDDKATSWLVDIYDMAPRFVFGRHRRDPSGALDPVERSFSIDKRKFRIQIDPAKVRALKTTKNWEKGDWIDALPGKRERVIEDVLRRFAVDGRTYQGPNGELGVIFKLYDLRCELERLGHAYSYAEIKQGLDVLCKVSLTTFEIFSTGKEQEIIDRLLERRAGATEEGWVGLGHRTAFIVFFNEYVKKAALELTYRSVNYDKIMSYRREISVYLHKRMSLRFLQASLLEQFSILLTTVIAGCGLNTETALKDQNKQMKLSLDEMKSAEVLLKWDVVKKDHDYLYVLTPHPSFVAEMKQSNRLAKEMRAEIGK